MERLLALGVPRALHPELQPDPELVAGAELGALETDADRVLAGLAALISADPLSLGTWLERLQLPAAERDRVARAAGAAPRVVTALRLRDQRPPSQLARLLAGEPPETLALALALGAPPASILELDARTCAMSGWRSPATTWCVRVCRSRRRSAARSRARWRESSTARSAAASRSWRPRWRSQDADRDDARRWSEPIEVELPGARVAFSTRRGGVSEGPYESLNLGILTDDEPDSVQANRRHLAQALGIQRIAMGMQVHGRRRGRVGWPVRPT